MLRLDESFASDSEYTSDPDTGLKKQLDGSRDDKEQQLLPQNRIQIDEKSGEEDILAQIKS